MYSLIYVLFIVALNWGFSHVPVIPLPWGDVWPPLSVAVGAVFVLRDLAQREVGHRVLGLMLFGAALSFWLADPHVALASLAAFAVSELVDWGVYSFANMDFKRRVLVSSCLSAPVDSAVFMWGIGVHSVTAVLIMTLSKFVGVAVAWKVSQR
jgi:hypothetical protein